jgi:coenzyme F420-0:L-glutamate ligase/coenzyme F420-1:gamma-L-glutamate ligase
MGPWDMQLRAVPGIPMISAGDDLAAIIGAALAADGHALRDSDVVVVAQKIVSKAEGRVVALNTVTAGPEAHGLAGRTGRDARLCQLILDESAEILAVLGRHIITVDVRGLVDTAGGVDSGNAGPFLDGWACLLPEDPDASARRIRHGIRDLTGRTPGVIISDSLGDPFREGSRGAAIGIAGIAAVEKPASGEKDLYDNPMWGDMNRVDELAGAASALMGQGDAARPVVLVRGASWTAEESAAIRDLLVPDPGSSFPLSRTPQNT